MEVVPLQTGSRRMVSALWDKILKTDKAVRTEDSEPDSSSACVVLHQTQIIRVKALIIYRLHLRFQTWFASPWVGDCEAGLNRSLSEDVQTDWQVSEVWNYLSSREDDWTKLHDGDFSDIFDKTRVYMLPKWTCSLRKSMGGYTMLSNGRSRYSAISVLDGLNP